MNILSEDIDDDEGDFVGSFEGYSVDKNEENWKNFLHSEISTSNAADFIINLIENSSVTNIAILRNINVVDEYRGEGFGSELMNSFIDKASDNCSDLFILFADKGETQRNGFKLTSWYSDYGYDEVLDEPDAVLMIWDVANKLDLDGKSIKEKLAEHLNASANNVKLKFS